MPEAVTTRQLEIAAMLSRNGLYILGNPLYTGWTGVAVVLEAKEDEGKPGRVFALVPGEEFSTDAEAWAEKGTHVAGGPFSVQTCEEQERIDDAAATAMEIATDELTFWRSFATKAASMLMSYEHILRRVDATQEADDVKALLDSVKPLEPTT